MVTSKGPWKLFWLSLCKSLCVQMSSCALKVNLDAKAVSWPVVISRKLLGTLLH